MTRTSFDRKMPTGRLLLEHTGVLGAVCGNGTMPALACVHNYLLL
jgi:hypothetical protein